ncbi:MAG: hypothetical protein ACR2GA_00830 [Chloroflexota bacterium]
MEAADNDFEIMAAGLRADSGDLVTFVDVLAAKLEGALPGSTVVERSGGRFGRPKQVRGIKVSLGDERFDLQMRNSQVETTHARAVRGIVLKTEELPLDAWIDELSQTLNAEAQRSDSARRALERLLNP